VGKAQQLAEAVQARAKLVADRAQEERRRHETVDACFEIADRDGEVGGAILAGALAYRLFIWLLPFSLVVVGVLGAVSSAATESPKAIGKSLGLAGLVSNSVASASKSTAHWYAILVGVPILVYETRNLLRALIASHRLVWGEVRASAPKPTVLATLKLLGAMLALFAITGLAGWVRARSGGFGLLATIGVALGYTVLWLLVLQMLPHRGARWTALVPGAVAFAVSLEVLQILAAYLIGPYALEKEGTYGALGVAAVLLLALYVIGRVAVGAAAVNATLVDRRTRGG